MRRRRNYSGYQFAPSPRVMYNTPYVAGGGYNRELAANTARNTTTDVVMLLVGLLLLYLWMSSTSRKQNQLDADNSIVGGGSGGGNGGGGNPNVWAVSIYNAKSWYNDDEQAVWGVASQIASSPNPKAAWQATVQAFSKKYPKEKSIADYLLSFLNQDEFNKFISIANGGGNANNSSGNSGNSASTTASNSGGSIPFNWFNPMTWGYSSTTNTQSNSSSGNGVSLNLTGKKYFNKDLSLKEVTTNSVDSTIYLRSAPGYGKTNFVKSLKSNTFIGVTTGNIYTDSLTEKAKTHIEVVDKDKNKYWVIVKYVTIKNFSGFGAVGNEVKMQKTGIAWFQDCTGKYRQCQVPAGYFLGVFRSQEKCIGGKILFVDIDGKIGYTLSSNTIVV